METSQKVVLGLAGAGAFYYLFMRNPTQEENQVGGGSDSWFTPDGSNSAGGSDTFNFSDLFGTSGNGSSGNNDVTPSSKKLDNTSIIPDASTSATGLVVKNSFGTYSPLDSRGNVLPQSVANGKVQNQFGGFSPVVNGVQLPQSTPAPIISKKSNVISTPSSSGTKTKTSLISKIKRLF